MKQLNVYSTFVFGNRIPLASIFILVFCSIFTVNGTFAQSCKKPFFGVPEELTKNRYKEPEMAYGHPYTMFNKRENNFNIDTVVKYLRVQILNEINDLDSKKELSIIYSSIYITAKKGMPADYATDDSLIGDPSELALWTKYNAFVLLIGLDGTGGEIDRNEFIARVEAGFANMNCEGTRKEGKDIIFASTAICWIQACTNI